MSHLFLLSPWLISLTPEDISSSDLLSQGTASPQTPTAYRLPSLTRSAGTVLKPSQYLPPQISSSCVPPIIKDLISPKDEMPSFSHSTFCPVLLIPSPKSSWALCFPLPLSVRCLPVFPLNHRQLPSCSSVTVTSYFTETQVMIKSLPRSPNLNPFLAPAG